MTFEEVNDDLGLSMKPYRVVACLAVHGRLPLLKHTIERLYKKNGCYKVVCAGDGQEEKKLCDSLGAIWTPHRNKPLGMKWNAAFQRAKDFNPDAVVFVGSSDWLSDNWFQVMWPYVERYGFAGVPGCSLLDIGESVRAVAWPGYRGYRAEREDECIGIGRMLSRRLMEAIDWTPFDPQSNNSLDRSMKDRSAIRDYVDFMIHDTSLTALSLSTSGPYKWPKDQKNKHDFEMHWTNIIPSEKINPELIINKFPEANDLIDALKNYPRLRQQVNR